MSRNGKGIAVVGAAILTLGDFPHRVRLLRGCGEQSCAGEQPRAVGERRYTDCPRVINKIDSYLVLLTEDGEYQIMDYSSDVVLDNFAEGDTVDITYTGQLGDESASPMIVSIAKSS